MPPGRCFDAVHIIIGQTEMMADLVDGDMGDKVLQKVGGRALSPISPDYLHLFRQQEQFAKVILEAVRGQSETPTP